MLKMLKMRLQAHPDDTGLLFAQAWAAQAAGQMAVAQQRYERVLMHQPDHAAALNNLAMLRLDRQQAGALPLAERAAQWIIEAAGAS